MTSDQVEWLWMSDSSACEWRRPPTAGRQLTPPPQTGSKWRR